MGLDVCFGVVSCCGEARFTFGFGFRFGFGLRFQCFYMVGLDKQKVCGQICVWVWVQILAAWRNLEKCSPLGLDSGVDLGLGCNIEVFDGCGRGK